MAEVKKATPAAAGNGEMEAPSNFIRAIIENDIRNNKYGGRIVTRFPPEPNGYLHIGHAKSICLNFGLAEDYDGSCNLRFDDTNPETEEMEYVEAIERDVRWLGFDWGEREYFASDYFARLYAYAEHLVVTGMAYVDSLSEEEIRAYRGTVTEPGTESPHRDRSPEENLDLLRRMRAGEFGNGEHVLRAKGDMASPNMKMRDPLLYRIRHAHHYRTGDEWCIYPMYDFAHPLSDAIENVTHSLCTLEFDNNRELYDWVLDHTVDEPRPRQYEFARLNLDYTVTSKRKLLKLVREKFVDGWDDPRMPTIAGLRRRGVTRESIRAFCDLIGVSKADNRVDIGVLEHAIRDDLNFRAPRVMCVLRPLKVVITNYPEAKTEWLDAPYWPHDVPREGSRKVPFGREIYIDRDDFREDPPRGYYRLAPGAEVRLRYGYFVTCEKVVRDEAGELVELHCTYDPETRGGSAPDGRKVRGTIHWVAADESLPAEVRLYDRLFVLPDPEVSEEDFTSHLNPESLVIVRDARMEPSVASDDPDTRYQFEREGYFWRDPEDSSPEALVFNRIVPLRDTWSKIEERREKTSDSEKASTPDAREQAVQPEARERLVQPASPSTQERVAALSSRQRERFEKLTARDLSDEDAVIIAEDVDLFAYFEDAVRSYASPQSIAKWIVNELLRELKAYSFRSFPVDPSGFAELVRLIDEDVISGRVAKDVFSEMIDTGETAGSIVAARNLEQIADPHEVEPVVREVVDSFPDKVAQYREGKTGLVGFFIGQVMSRTGGKAKPALVKEMVEERLKGP